MIIRDDKIPSPIVSSPPHVYISTSVLDATKRFLQASKYRCKKHEGIVYWAGRDSGEDWLILTCIAPRATTTRGSFKVSAKTNAHVIMLLNKLHLTLLAQVHSHPGSWVDHSPGDNEGVFMPYKYFLSIIVPYYSVENLWPLTTCGVHRFSGTTFYRLTNSEIEENIQLLPTSCDLRK